ncbi:MAG TPA: hypothetical protein ENJ09_00985 [Planctomycetes bacterium]|nr:hypothetical protein [Planctomycetota bacterium]
MQNRLVSARRFATLLALVLPPALGSCVSTSPQRKAVTDGPWIAASPVLQQQIQDEAKRLPWTHGFERLEQIRWFASLGEPGYATLLDLATDPRDDVAAAAFAAMGATLDNRLVPYIREIRIPSGEDHKDLQLERARTLVRLGDWGEIPTLIAGLRDDRVYTRSLCHDALTEATHEDKGFDPRASDEAREAAVSRWEQWWRDRSSDSLLSAAN